MHDSVVFGEGPVGLSRVRPVLGAGHENRIGGPVGPELVLKLPGTWVRGASLSSCFSFPTVPAFLAQDLFHKRNGTPSPLFRAFRLMNVKFFALFQLIPWSCLGERPGLSLLIEYLLRIWSKDTLV